LLQNNFSYFSSLFKSKTLKNISVVLTGGVANSLLGFLGTVLVLRQLDVEAIGIIYPLLSIMLMLGQFIDFGITQTCVKLASSHYHKNPSRALEIFNTSFRLKIILSVFTLILAMVFKGQISYLLFNDKSYENWVLVTLLLSFFSIMASFYTGILQVEGKFKVISLTRVLPSFIKFTILATLLYVEKLDLFYCYIAFFSVPVITFLMTFISSRKDFYKVQIDFRQTSGEIYKYSKWLFVSMVTVAGIGQLDSLMVRSMQGSHELAILLGGLKLSSILLVFAVALITILLPKVSSMQGPKELNFFIRKVLLFSPLFLILIVIGIPIARFLIPILLSEKYIESIPVFQIYFIGFCLDLFLTPFGLVLLKLNKERRLASLNVAQLLLNLIGNYFLIPLYGAEGAAISSMSLRLLGILFTLVLLYRSGVLFYREKPGQ
jgi:O-antigen/teichoic acid export membrane protein